MPGDPAGLHKYAKGTMQVFQRHFHDHGANRKQEEREKEKQEEQEEREKLGEAKRNPEKLKKLWRPTQLKKTK